jgi:hypothetical protein
VDVPPLEEGRIDPPTQTILQRYLSLDPPTAFAPSELEARFGSSSKARQFSMKARGSRLAVRLDRGSYVAVDPSVAIRAWAVPDYHARILVLHDALAYLGIEHVFACLGASAETELIFERPWLVIPPSGEEPAPEIERFTYEYRSPATHTIHVMGETFELPSPSPEETALLLASTGLPRAVEAARSWMERRPPPDRLVPCFNYVGLDLDPDTVTVEDPEVDFPGFIERQRRSLGEELLRGGGR